MLFQVNKEINLKPKVPYRQIRALQTEGLIRVYQAYSPSIALPAVKAQTFVSPFSSTRMTWIKPSFLWMMYRSNWGNSHNQERVLAIDITVEGFRWAMEHSCLSHFDTTMYESNDAWAHQLANSCVRIQWDPERNWKLGELPYRSIQVGITGEAVRRFTSDWIRKITDISDVVESIRNAESTVKESMIESITKLELPFELDEYQLKRIGATPNNDS
jgi:hypothetical protein